MKSKKCGQFDQLGSIPNYSWLARLQMKTMFNKTQLSQDVARWWREWHEYKLNDDNIPAYGSCMLFKPNRKPNLSNFMLLTDSIHLSDSSCYIHGPFNFDSRSDVISAK